MRYGHFSSDGLEFIITSPDTPRPWINYLTNETYCAIVSQCGGGYSFYRDCRSHRTTRWAPENWHFDRPGRYVFARDDRGHVWSLTHQPLRRAMKRYECRHGLGYTTIHYEFKGIHSEVTYFVPEKDPCEVWRVTLTNKTKQTRRLTVMPYIEFLLGDYHEELRYRNIMNLYNLVSYDADEQVIWAQKTAMWKGMNIQPFDSVAFFASSLPVEKACTRKDVFMGSYNDEQNPEAVMKGAFPHEPLCSGEDAIGSFRHTIILKPGQSKTFTIILGEADSRTTARRLIKAYRDVQKSNHALERTQKVWRKKILENIVVETPDPDFNVFFNIWAKYQVFICNLWSRSPSYYHEGSGGRGYRDSAQDSEAICSIDPALTRKRIFQLASLIRRDGTCAPGWSETAGPHQFRPNKDHPVWLTVTVAAYIKETGDAAILDEYAPYLKDKWIRGWDIDPTYTGGPQTDGEGTIFEHLEANLKFCFNDVGEKGFPRIGHADWNDAIDAAGIKHRGESVWLAQALVRSLRVMSELCRHTGRDEKAAEFEEMAHTMQERINEHGWDGRWYVRGFDDNGQVYGSRKDKEGKIFLNTQAWALLSQTVPSSRLKPMLKSVSRYLDGPYGLALFAPAYTKWVPRLGRISMFSPGTKENAAVFCHAVMFMAVGYAIYGMGDEAHQALRKVLPNAQDQARYKTEPYVFAEYLVGPDNPYRYGEGAFTWITGSSGWSFMLATEWILGARRDYEGLRLDPCLPSHWKAARIRRPFRGAVYDIRIENPKGVNKGVKEIWVDGQIQAQPLIRPHADGQVHEVRVVMG